MSREESKVRNVHNYFDPPILSTESKLLYCVTMRRVMEAIMPRDFVEQLLAKDVVDCTFGIQRLQKCKSRAIDCEYRRHLEIEQTRRQKVQKRKAATAKRRKEATDPAAQANQAPVDGAGAGPAGESKQAQSVDSVAAAAGINGAGAEQAGATAQAPLRDQGPASAEVAGETAVEPEAESTTEAGEQTSQFDRILGLEAVVETGPMDVDEIVDGYTQEDALARAMQDAIGFYEQLDGLLAKAIARRNDALKQLELYRAVWDMICAVS
jgi:hypothetical protein